MDLELKQIETREGSRGDVHDTYHLLYEGQVIQRIEIFVEYSWDEVPIQVELMVPTQVKGGRVDGFSQG